MECCTYTYASHTSDWKNSIFGSPKSQNLDFHRTNVVVAGYKGKGGENKMEVHYFILITMTFNTYIGYDTILGTNSVDTLTEF